MKPQHNTEYNVNNNTAEYVLDVSATEYDPTDSSKSSKFMCLVKRQSSVAKMMRSLLHNVQRKMILVAEHTIWSHRGRRIKHERIMLQSSWLGV